MTYGMFTQEGNELVGRIVDAAVRAVDELGDTPQVAWQFLYHNLVKLSHSDHYGEATDTVVREACIHALENRTAQRVISG